MIYPIIMKVILLFEITKYSIYTHFTLIEYHKFIIYKKWRT